MKKGIHPENYRLVAFKDMSNNDVFITKSAVETKDSIKVDGVDYPLVKLEISRTSHPYYTGKTKLVDTAGRIDKFKNRYAGLSLKNQKSSNQEAPVDEAPVAERHPVVNVSTVFRCGLRQQHARLEVLDAVGPCVPYHGHQAGLPVSTLVKPGCLSLRGRHPFVPPVSRDDASAALGGCAKHRLLVQCFAASVDRFASGGFGPRRTEPPSHQAKMTLHLLFTLRADLRGHGNETVGGNVPRRLERREVRQRFCVHLGCQFIHRRGECKPPAHDVASNRVAHHCHQRIHVQFCGVERDSQFIHG